MTMFTRILVPLAGTPESAVALPPARAIARVSGAEIVLCQVIPDRDADAAAIGEVEAALEKIAVELRSGGVDVEVVVALGDVPEQILSVAGERGVELIVMATHGRSGLGRAILGSVTERVLAKAGVPVMVLRPGGHRLTRVSTLLVPVDGTPGGSVALGLALGLARMTQAKIVLLRVVEPIPTYLYDGAYWSGGAYIDPEWDEEARQSAQGFVDGMALRLKRAGVEAEGRAVLGDVVTTIVDTAEAVDADAIIMSTHALTGAARAILGSVADAVVRHAPRPVLLIRRDAPVAVTAAPDADTLDDSATSTAQ